MTPLSDRFSCRLFYKGTIAQCVISHFQDAHHRKSLPSVANVPRVQAALTNLTQGLVLTLSVIQLGAASVAMFLAPEKPGLDGNEKETCKKPDGMV